MSIRQHAAAVLLFALVSAPGSGLPPPAAAGPGTSLAPIPEAEQPATGAGQGTTASFGDSWRELGPPARAGQASIYDEKRSRVVVFGGRVGRVLRGDVWTVSTRRPSAWERANPLGQGPAARSNAAAVYDRKRDRMLVFFGQDSAGVLGDVWELSLNGRLAWRRLKPSGMPPGARMGHTATLDPENDRVIVYGGGEQVPYWCDPDVWQLSLSPHLVWTRVAVEGPRPSARAYHSAVYAPDLHGVIVFGGLGTVREDPWIWDLHDSTDVWLLSTRGAARWTDLTPLLSGAPCCGVHGHSAVYDAGTSRMFVLDGYQQWANGRPFQNERASTWWLSLKDLTWVTQEPADGPRRRVCATAVPAGDRGMFVFGGTSNTVDWSGSYSDAWCLRLDGEPAWSRIIPASEPPEPTRWKGQSAIYDPVRDRTLLWQDGTLWGRPVHGDGAWRSLATEGEMPPKADGHVVTYDSRRDRLIVYGGGAERRTCEKRAWALTLSSPMTWTLLEPTGDAPDRTDAAAVYDPVRDRVLIYGGASTVAYGPYNYPKYEGDVWALSLAGVPSWERIAPERVGWTADRLDASAIYDPVRDRMIVFGGGVPDADSWMVYNDVWALPLGGEPEWQQLVPFTFHPTNAPEGRAFHPALYDEVGDRMIVVGGYCPGPFQKGPWNDAWSLDLSSAQWTRLSPAGGPAPGWMGPLAIRDTRRHSTMVMEWAIAWSLESGPGRSCGRAAVPTSLRSVGETMALALHGLHPNPSAGPFSVELSLPDAGPAQLDLLDAAGRRVWAREVGSFGPGRHVVTIGDGLRAPSGLYWLRLTRGGTIRTLKVVRIR